MEAIIELSNITKEYDNKEVVKNLNLKIQKGEIFGFLGPNGAGKSTSINMMVGLLKPTKGEIKINSTNKSKTDIGICPQDIVLWEHLTCYENLFLMGKMYEVPKDELKQRSEEILEQLLLTDKRNSKITDLSGGMKRRMNIAMATIHNPEILVLDEPSEGLDPQSRRVLWDYIRLQKEKGKTIILTTHLMDEADKLSDRVGIIDNGELLQLDTPEKLKQSIGEGDILELSLKNKNNIPEIINELKQQPDAKNIIQNDETKISLNLLAAVNKLPQIIHIIENNNNQLKDMNMRQNTLEDVFIELTGKQLRE